MHTPSPPPGFTNYPLGAGLNFEMNPGLHIISLLNILAYISKI